MATGERCTIVYDGTCPYCRRQMNWIRQRDTWNHFTFVPSQEDGLLRQFPMLADQDLQTGLRLIDLERQVHVGADAVYQVARRLPRVRWFVWLYRIPGLTWFWRRIYAWIAANRYKLRGECTDNSCDV